MVDLIWLAIGFFPATIMLLGIWYAGEDITVKGLIIYVFGVIGGILTLLFFLLVLIVLIFSCVADFIKSFDTNIFKRVVIRGYGNNHNKTEFM